MFNAERFQSSVGGAGTADGAAKTVAASGRRSCTATNAPTSADGLGDATKGAGCNRDSTTSKGTGVPGVEAAGLLGGGTSIVGLSM